jgi:hypothetical protein
MPSERDGAARGQFAALEWCRCGAPVSNWEQHGERTGHRREGMLRYDNGRAGKVA